MSIQFNMTNVQELGQESIMWGISNSDDSQGGCKRIDKQSPLWRPSHPSEIPTLDKKASKGKKRTQRNERNHVEESPDHEIHIWTERERRKKMRDMFAKLHALLPQLPPKVDKSTIVDEAVSSIKSLEQTLHNLQMRKLQKLQYSSASNTTTTTTTAFPYDPSSSPTTLLTPISNQPQILPVGAASADSYSREALLANQISSSSMNLPYPCNDPTAEFDTWSTRNVVLNICGNEAFFILCCPKDKSRVFTNVCYLFEKYNVDVIFANVSSNHFRSTYMIQAQVKPSYENQLLGDEFGAGEIFKQAAQELALYFSSP